MATRAVKVTVKAYDAGTLNAGTLGNKVEASSEYKPSVKPTLLHKRYAQYVADASIAAVLLDVLTLVEAEGGTLGYP